MIKNERQTLRITLDVIDENTMKIVKTELVLRKSNSLTDRQLEFKRDDTKQLLTKLKSVRYSKFKDEIYKILMNRYNKAYQNPTRERNKKTIELISLFLRECFDNVMKSTDIKDVA